MVQAYLRARWHGTKLAGEVDDAVQDLFVDCYRTDGVLSRAEPGRGQGFRAFLFGAVRLIALRFERRSGQAGPFDDEPISFTELPADQDAPSRAFQRAWALALVTEARRRQERQSRDLGADAERRVELLRLRFEDGLPIREIAERWGVDAETVHRAYARARREFNRCLREVVAYHIPHPSVGPERIDAECEEILRLLG